MLGTVIMITIALAITVPLGLACAVYLNQIRGRFSRFVRTIVEAMSGQGPMSIREVARRVGRDFKGVHSDVGVLTRNGVLMKTAEGQVIFPYAKIHFDFEFAAADQSAA